MVSIGGDTQFMANLEYRIPIINQVTFAFFTDFGMDFDAQAGQLRQSTAGNSLISGAQYGCPTFVNGACFGGSSVKFPVILPVVPGTNYVPRMSNGAELQVILPIVNAPFRIFYAYNSLRLYEDIPQKLAVPNSGPNGIRSRATSRPREQASSATAGAAALWGRLHPARAEKDVPADGQHNLLAFVEEANACDAGGSGVEAGGGIFEGDATERVDRDG